MKTNKLTKVVAAVFAIALLVGTCFALAVSADDTPTITIAKNVDFQDKYTVAFALESSDENAEFDLVYYLEDPALNPDATAYTPVKGSTEKYDNVFYTHGFSAQNIGDEVWATATIVGTDVTKTVKYSVAEYIYSMLYKHGKILATEGVAADEKAFFESFIEFASNAQTVLENNKLPEGETPEALVKNYYAALVVDGTLDGESSYAFSKEAFSVTLNFTGAVPSGKMFDTWVATTNGESTNVANGATVALTGSTVFTPSFKLNNNTLITGATFDNVTTLIGDGTDRVGIKFSYGIGNIENADKGKVVDGDEISIAKDPTNENNQVLKFKDGSTSSFSTFFIQASSDYHGVVRNGISVFETKIYVPKSEILCSGGQAVAQPQFNYNGRSSLHLESLYVNDAKTYVFFALDNTDGSETSGNITVDAWHALRLEYYNYSSTELGKPIIKVYVDNLYAGYMEATTTKTNDISGFMWRGLSSSLITIYFDNMSFSEKAMPTD